MIIERETRLIHGPDQPDIFVSFSRDEPPHLSKQSNLPCFSKVNVALSMILPRLDLLNFLISSCCRGTSDESLSYLFELFKTVPQQSAATKKTNLNQYLLDNILSSLLHSAHRNLDSEAYS